MKGLLLLLVEAKICNDLNGVLRAGRSLGRWGTRESCCCSSKALLRLPSSLAHACLVPSYQITCCVIWIRISSFDNVGLALRRKACFLDRFGPILCYRYGTLVMIPLCLLSPALSLLAADKASRFFGLMGVLVVRNIASTTAFTGVLLIVSNSSPPEDAGKVSLVSFLHQLSEGGSAIRQAQREADCSRFEPWPSVAFPLMISLAGTKSRPTP